MSEAPTYPVPLPDQEPVDANEVKKPKRWRSTSSKVLDFTNRKFINLMTARGNLGKNQQLMAYSVLGAIALGTKFVEFRYGAFTKNTPEPIETLIGSGSHGVVGLLGADLALRYPATQNRAGVGAVVLGFDYLTEAAQALVFTKEIHGGSWHDAAAFTKPPAWEYENSRDLVVAELVGQAEYEVFGYQKRRAKNQGTELPEAA